MERQEVAVKWYKNGTELENNDKYRVNTDGHWHYLEIRDITIEDEGKYLAKIAGSSFESMAELLVDGAKVNLFKQGLFSYTSHLMFIIHIITTTNTTSP